MTFLATVQYPISTSSLKYLNESSTLASTLTCQPFHLSVLFSQLTANFIRLKPLYFASLTTSSPPAINKVSTLVLLDLSAAFDTIDHNILLTRLSCTFGISETALTLLSSYLLSRTQSDTIRTHSTPPALINTGVPQFSVLGPLLFSLYTSPIIHIFSDSSISFHLYADDTQLYISFASSGLFQFSFKPFGYI